MTPGATVGAGVTVVLVAGVVSIPVWTLTPEHPFTETNRAAWI